ncbi:MAG: hypothetical protein ACI9XK_000566 [Granulosicoccus sp.]|jgi:hypothetical protein
MRITNKTQKPENLRHFSSFSARRYRVRLQVAAVLDRYILL